MAYVVKLAALAMAGMAWPAACQPANGGGAAV
jgi:hypothetical protein